MSIVGDLAIAAAGATLGWYLAGEPRSPEGGCNLREYRELCWRVRIRGVGYGIGAGFALIGILSVLQDISESQVAVKIVCGLILFAMATIVLVWIAPLIDQLRKSWLGSK